MQKTAYGQRKKKRRGCNKRKQYVSEPPAKSPRLLQGYSNAASQIVKKEFQNVMIRTKDLNTTLGDAVTNRPRCAKGTARNRISIQELYRRRHDFSQCQTISNHLADVPATAGDPE
jgi:hypothetical protein